MASVLENDGLDVRSDQLHLMAQKVSQGLLAADRQDRHRERPAGPLREVLGRPREGGEVGPARTHAPRARVGGGVGHPIRFRNRPRLVGREVVPVVVVVRALATVHQSLGRGTMEAEMPEVRVVVDRPPVAYAGKKASITTSFSVSAGNWAAYA